MFSGGQLSRSRGPLKLHKQATLQLRQSHRAFEDSSKGSVLLPQCQLCCTLNNTRNVTLVEERVFYCGPVCLLCTWELEPLLGNAIKEVIC
jgi:hypothetical protein